MKLAWECQPQLIPFSKRWFARNNMPFDMKIERPKLHSKSGNATLNRAFIVKRMSSIRSTKTWQGKW